MVAFVFTVMASLQKPPRSLFYFACNTFAPGRPTRRSTGTDDKRKAMVIATLTKENLALNSKQV